MMFPLVLYPLHLRQYIALFAVAKGLPVARYRMICLVLHNVIRKATSKSTASLTACLPFKLQVANVSRFFKINLSCHDVLQILTDPGDTCVDATKAVCSDRN